MPQENTAEVGVLDDDLTTRLTLMTLAEEAGVSETLVSTTIAYTAEVAVITEAATAGAYAATAEVGVVGDSITGSASFVLRFSETAKLDDSLTGAIAPAALAETAVVTETLATVVPTETSAETALLGDSITGARTVTAIIRETAAVAGAPVSVVYATTAETAVLDDGVTATQVYNSLVEESAALGDALTGTLSAYALTSEIAVVGDALTSLRTTTVLAAEVGRIYDELAFDAGTIGWSAHIFSFATTQYSGHPAQQIMDGYALSRINGVLEPGDEVFDFTMQTAQSDFGDPIGKRCTHIQVGTSPTSEYTVSLMAELPDGTVAAYPAQVWPRGTGRFIREFNAPRGVLSPSLGVTISGSAPDAFDLSSLKITPLISGRR